MKMVISCQYKVLSKLTNESPSRFAPDMERNLKKTTYHFVAYYRSLSISYMNINKLTKKYVTLYSVT